MSDEAETTTPRETSADAVPRGDPPQLSSSPTDNASAAKATSAIQSLSRILPSLPPSLSSSPLSLLHDADVTSRISSLLRQPDSGAGDNPLCGWLYETFHSNDPLLQLVVLRFLPIIAGLYLSRVSHKPSAGFEAILLALYGHETNYRNGHPITVNVPDMKHPSIYHDQNRCTKSLAIDLNLAVLSPSLEPHVAVRSTKRARIVGVALELYYSKIFAIPVESKMDFCEYCRVWAGEEGDAYDDSKSGGEEEESKREKVEVKDGRILLPWELLQPVLRILGHCMLGVEKKNKELQEAAAAACRSLYARSLHDINSKGILASRSLLRSAKMGLNSSTDPDPTEIPYTNKITV